MRTNIDNNASAKELLSHEKTKFGLTQFLEKQNINHLNGQDISFAVAGNGENHIKKQGTVAIARNNHEESDTLGNC